MGIKAFNHGDDFVNKFIRAVVSDSTGLDAVSDEPAASGLTATGGVISDYTDGSTVYRAHIFTTSGTFTVTDDTSDFGTNVEYVVVAGGGAGGSGAYRLCGGGGAGGLLSNHPDVPASSPTGATRQAAYPVSPGSYTVSIGAGGAGAADGTIVDGSASNFYPTPVSHPHPTYIRALGGGGGGGNPNPGSNGGGGTSGNPGGSGGGNTEGGSGSFSIGGGGSGTTGQGSNGGKTASGLGGGGGGGAGEAGCQDDNGPIPANPPGAYTNGGYGGDGMQVRIAGSPLSDQPVGTPGTSPGGGYFAGGGGGSYQPNTNAPLKGIGGEGGGGYGIVWPGGVNPFGQDGLTSTGGGGGGAAAQTGPAKGGNGGSGIVVVRYQIGTVNTGDAKATGGSISFYGGKTIHVFTSSGTFVNPASIDNVEVVMVAGGGSGGLNIGGGGGAGAVLESPSSGFTFPASTYTVTVGAGGASKSSTGPATANTANNTTISYPGPYTWTAQRGGYGGSYPDVGAQSGGSGGGAAPDPSTASGGAKTAANSPTPIGTLTAYGNAGGDVGHQYQGAGGGGAGAAGSDSPGPGVGGSGGVGRQLPTTFRNPAAAPSDSSNPQPYQRGGGLGTPGPSPGGFYVAAGGGGAAYSADTPSNRGLGGAGGGGDGAWHTQNPPNTDGQPALENTGSGGGGAGYSPSTKSTAGSGGSGIVLIAYPT